MNTTLENWLRDKLRKNEEMQDFLVATETLRIWIDEYNDLKKEINDEVVEKSIKCKFGEYANELYDFFVEKIENNKEKTFTYDKKQLYVDFLDSNNLFPLDVKIKFFTHSVYFFCYKKGVLIDERVVSCVSKYDGSARPVRFFFKKQNNI